MAGITRLRAVSILNRVERSAAYVEDLLDRTLQSGQIGDERNCRLLTELTYGTLRIRSRKHFLA